MLGVIIGGASVVALVAVGQGSTQNITDRLSGLGTNLLTINPGSSQQGGTFGAAGSSESLTLWDAQSLEALMITLASGDTRLVPTDPNTRFVRDVDVDASQVAVGDQVRAQMPRAGFGASSDADAGVTTDPNVATQVVIVAEAQAG